ncbi:RNA polymerase sigma factor [Candidatus Falkowbacteria bacterium]|nr:RNA polymerase sigma factor [Candidatus Falkowbacteria bacterium]
MTTIECDNLSDEELVGRVLKEADYFKCIVDRYEPALRRYISRLSNCSPDAIDDILQNVFLKCYLNLNDFNVNLKFSSWLYRIAHNETINEWRKHKNRFTSFDDQDVSGWRELAADIDLEQEVEQTLLAEKVKKSMSGLDPKYAEILLLRFWEGYDYQEISDIVKKPVGTVASLINRAKAQLKKEIKKSKI